MTVHQLICLLSRLPRAAEVVVPSPRKRGHYCEARVAALEDVQPGELSKGRYFNPVRRPERRNAVCLLPADPAAA